MFEHWGRAIYWNTLSWEAFVAFFAVLAAGIVGWRQMVVMDRQAEIANLAVKEAVWDRRMAIHDTTKEFLTHIVIKGRVPGRTSAYMVGSTSSPAGLDIAIAFHDAVDRSQFLMSDEIHARLVEIEKKAKRLGDIHEDAASLYNPTKDELQSEATDLRAFLVGHYNNVAAIFGDDLRLRT